MRSPRRPRTGVALLCLLTLTATACGGGADSSQGAPAPGGTACGTGTLATPKSVRLGVNPGAQDLVTFVMQQQGFDKKRKLQLNIKRFQNPPGLHTAISEKVVDIGFAGLTAMAVARAHRRHTMIFNILTGPSNIVFVPKSSPVHRLSDFKGRKLGAFGGESSVTFAILSAVAKEIYGISDLAADTSVVDAPDAALTGLMDQGRIDGALLGTTATIQALLSGKYRVVSDMAADYEKKFGRPPGHVVVASTDDYAAKNCDVLMAFSGALSDTLTYMKSHDQVWSDYAKQIKLTDPRAPQMLKERAGTRYIAKWDQAQENEEIKLIQRLIGVLGADKFVSAVPKGLFRLDLQPGA
jgi:ABC-type nitrate/sulfonate/bicarbonate transport system substrate-binding protein